MLLSTPVIPDCHSADAVHIQYEVIRLNRREVVAPQGPGSDRFVCFSRL
jgi:hypothetical protein